eukprot:2910-Pelagococcus_subviridis.AAC.6
MLFGAGRGRIASTSACDKYKATTRRERAATPSTRVRRAHVSAAPVRSSGALSNAPSRPRARRRTRPRTRPRAPPATAREKDGDVIVGRDAKPRARDARAPGRRVASPRATDADADAPPPTRDARDGVPPEPDPEPELPMGCATRRCRPVPPVPAPDRSVVVTRSIVARTKEISSAPG